MTMTNEEICRDYRAAKAPSKQIRILAELNQCSRDKIKQILVAGGCKLLGNCAPSKSKGVSLAIIDPDPDSAIIDDKPQKPAKLPGAKNDDGKLPLSTVPPAAIRAIAEIRRYGNQKYADPQNWRRVDPKKFHEAMLRHVLACWEDPGAVDPESGLPHLWHLMCNGAFLCAFLEGGSHAEDEA